MQSSRTTYTTTTSTSAPVIERVLLPTQVVEKPVAIHETIKKELIEEIQPVVNVEKIKTEVHQVTQPLFDKEVRPVVIENRTLTSEVLPEVRVEGRGFRAVDDVSTTQFLNTQTVVVEKPALYNEIERKQIIEEIQPVIYKETIVPTVVQETKPIYQKVVEGAVFSQQTLPMREVANRSTIAAAYVTDNTVVAPVQQRVMLPTQVVEKPIAVHEEVRRETIEEVQPVFNVEKIKTEIHQITAPLFDKEVRPVIIEKKILAQEVLPEVLLEGRGVRAVEDFSTTQYLDTRTTVIEKNAIYNEVERTQIIEEIQPVVYKETVVPTVIRETKPVFQKIVEGPVYTQQTLAPRSLAETNYRYPTSQTVIEVPATVPVVLREEVIVAPIVPIVETVVAAPVHGRKEVVEEVITTTTTTTTAPIVGGQVSGSHHRGLFHRHAHDNSTASGSTTFSSTGVTSSTSSLPADHVHTERSLGNGQKLVQDTTILHNTSLPYTTAPIDSQHFHKERVAGNGQKIVEDTTVTHSHSQANVPARLI